MSDYQKYLKYKNKYLELKNKIKIQKGGAITTAQLKFTNPPVPVGFVPQTIDFNQFIDANLTNIEKILNNFDNSGKPLFDVSATTFCDYYKWTMSTVFYCTHEYFNNKGNQFYVTFGVDIRDETIKNLLNDNTSEKGNRLRAKIKENLSEFVKRKFDKDIFIDLKKTKLAISELSWCKSTDNLNPPPPGCELSMSDANIDYICLNGNSQRTIAHENVCEDKYIPGKTPGYNPEDVVVSCYSKSVEIGTGNGMGMDMEPVTEDRYFIEATGPWPLVTWLETSMMQCVYETIMRFERGEYDDTKSELEKQNIYQDSLKYSLYRCYLSINKMIYENLNLPAGRAIKFNGALFAGRRTGSLLFLLLQNYMFRTLLPPPMGGLGTSSVDAWYLFKKFDIKADNWGPSNQLNTIGTHAHEKKMVLSVLFPYLDKFNVPVSQLFGDYLYYLLSGTRKISSDANNTNVSCLPNTSLSNLMIQSTKIPMLPDTLGTSAYMLAAITLNIKGKDFLNAIIASSRQDSGTLQAHIDTLAAFGCKYNIMASELDSFTMVRDAIRATRGNEQQFPYTLWGAGGLFGDSSGPWPAITSTTEKKSVAMAVKPIRVFIVGIASADTNYHTTELDQVITTDTMSDGKSLYVGYPVKLGDKKPGATEKISIDGTLDPTLRQNILDRAEGFRSYGMECRDNLRQRETFKNLNQKTICKMFSDLVVEFGYERTCIVEKRKEVNISTNSSSNPFLGIHVPKSFKVNPNENPYGDEHKDKKSKKKITI
jgi:hypothetical protein